MKIILDGFGGDNAPKEVLLGAQMAVKELNCQIVITGDVQKLQKTADDIGIDLNSIEFYEAPDVMPVEAEPMSLRTTYKHSSIAVGLRLLSEGFADAFVTAGSTGAAVLGSQTIVGRIKGIKRAAIGVVIPSSTGCYMLIDSGANHECRPEMLHQFGILGSAYMKGVIGVNNPRVGLINIGSEETKGTELQTESYQLLKNSGLNFVGNVEARDLPTGQCDVAVCDGFTGNIVLKLTEGLAKMFMGRLKTIFLSGVLSKLGYLLVKSGLKSMKKDFDYTEYGGSMILGVKKPVVKAHGSSNAKAFKNAIKQAYYCCESNIIETISEKLENGDIAE